MLSFCDSQRSLKIHFDIYLRPGKYQGGWFQRIGPREFSVQCNFCKGDFLDFDSIQTLMHECGHVMHAALSSAEFCLLKGIDVQWDFVEVFSQFFEQYSFSRDFLKMFIDD